MTYIIAEISGNHGGHLEKALELIETATKAGAAAVKFQLYRPEDLHDPANNHIYEKYQVPVSWLEPMFQLAEDIGTALFASVFAPWAVEALRPFQPSYYKIASPESTLLPDYRALVLAIRKTKIPILWSCGKEAGPADQYADRFGHEDAVMYCKAGYPATIDLDDFSYIRDLDGFSDHSAGIVNALAAIAVGANFIEKHFKIDDDCIDAAFSINPKELKALCDLSS